MVMLIMIMQVPGLCLMVTNEVGSKAVYGKHFIVLHCAGVEQESSDKWLQIG
jgi:hypothetical protein